MEEIKKYQISSGWKHPISDDWIEGYTEYSTLKELISAYEERIKNKDSKITRIGLSLKYTNSLDYRHRIEIEKQENQKIIDAFLEKGYDIFNFNYGILTLKSS